MKTTILSLLVILTSVDATAISLEVGDLPNRVTNEAYGPDVGLVPATIKLRYGKNWSRKDNPLLFTFNSFTVNHLDILAFVKDGKIAVVSYASNKSKM